MTELDSLTAIAGLTVGHWTDQEAATGCTVVICEEGAVASVDVRGGAPGTRETDLLQPGNLVEQVHAILLTGGSAFGLSAATGVMRWLEEQGVGFPTPNGPVPIVPAAVLADLGVGRADVRPDQAAGYAACVSAGKGILVQGSVGAGTGATVGKALGLSHAMKGGVGTSCERLASGVQVSALVAVNCFGEVVDADTGVTIAGPRDDSGSFVSTLDLLRERVTARPGELGAGQATNTTIGVIATDAHLTKAQCQRLAAISHDGLARTIRPVHTQVDGDTIFALATGAAAMEADMLALGALAVRAVERAVVHAVKEATSLAGIPAING